MATAQLTAGVDLGGTKIQTVLLAAGAVVGQSRAPTPQTGQGDDVIAAIVDTIREALAAAGSQRPPRRIGVGSPGEIDAGAGVVSLAARAVGAAVLAGG